VAGIELNLERVRNNVQESSTEDLLDRATVYAGGMEPQALDLIETELRDRGMTSEKIRLHAEERQQEGVLMHGDIARMCSFCRRPAVEHRIGWHMLWGLMPVFPRRFWYCAPHRDEGDKKAGQKQNRDLE